MLQLFHTLNRGVDKKIIFLDKQDYLRFIHDLFEFNDSNQSFELSMYKNELEQKIMGLSFRELKIFSDLINKVLNTIYEIEGEEIFDKKFPKIDSEINRLDPFTSITSSNSIPPISMMNMVSENKNKNVKTRNKFKNVKNIKQRSKKY